MRFLKYFVCVFTLTVCHEVVAVAEEATSVISQSVFVEDLGKAPRGYKWSFETMMQFHSVASNSSPWVGLSEAMFSITGFLLVYEAFCQPLWPWMKACIPFGHLVD